MAEALLGFVIAKLGEMVAGGAISAIEIQIPIKEDIQFIKGELSTMKAFLKDAEVRTFLKYEGQQNTGCQVVSQWVAQVRNEAYKVEDVLEEFFLQLHPKSRRQDTCLDIKFYIGFVPFFFKQIRLQRTIHFQIKTIRKEVGDIARRRLDYNFEERTMSTNVEETREDYGVSQPFVEEEDIVGIDDDVEEVQKILLNIETGFNQRIIISVIGMGGAGKTTLMKKVFKNVLGEFDCNAWLSVSQDYRPREILKSMLEGFHKSRKEVLLVCVDKLPTFKLQEMVYNYLQDKRYLLFLDDIWDGNFWEEIRHALPLGVTGRVILTTRNVNVASPAGETSYIYQLNPLTHKYAWILFCQKAFRENNPPGCPKNLKETAEAIVQKCAGLPLALAVIGSLLSKIESIDQWYNILYNLDCELNENQGLKRLNRALLTSYIYLPSHLKPCFLCIGMFPEDYIIKGKKLIRLWVAEGFIEKHSRKSLEEVGKTYLDQLVQRNMLQTHELLNRPGISKFKLHDLMRDMAIHMMQKEEFGDIIAKDSINVSNKQVRRLAIHNASVTPPLSRCSELIKVRSLYMFKVKEFLPSAFRQLVIHCKLLRVLNLSGAEIKDIPREVCDLIHLRYLSLRKTQVSKLPTSLHKLQSLQTFDIRNTLIKSFPRGIHLGTFPELRHLHTTVGISIQTTKNTNLCTLQTLWGVPANNGIVIQLHLATALRKLFILGIRENNCEAINEAIKEMKHLRSLKIFKYQDEEEIIDLESMCPPPPHIEKMRLYMVMKEGKLPNWIGSLESLHTFELGYTNLTQDPFSTLSELPNLKILLLWCNSYIERRMGWGNNTSGKECTKFPRLKYLFMSELPHLEELSAIEDGRTMPCLEDLWINKCPLLKKLPDGFQRLRSIRILRIGSMPVQFIERLRLPSGSLEGGEDHWMIRNISEVWITEYSLDGRLLSREKLNWKPKTNCPND